MAESNLDLARKLLAEIRLNRRSQTPDTLVKAAQLLDFEIDRSRAKGSHWWAVHHKGHRFPIPTSKNPVRVGTTTSILKVLEEVLNDVSPG
ncbi:hypothetical protein [Streptomyces sp. UNOB3_S3]|uniref:hypothetical protein n=1 Tax=Streptomyces sp. UNOB3_S3 TaxID=2871682 RepID=UPI001E2C602B|nr:hypothetical protein [Streptomyces sp. UNOB3_S3]MCC3779377.1 hypothetical protein [Streptomyces sp. UNOB3_S3]